MAFKVGSIFGEAILDTKKWVKGQGVIKGSLTALSRSVRNFAVGAGAALTGFMVSASIQAEKFQKSIKNVSTLIDGGANVADLSRELLTLDSALGSTIELTEGLYQAISAGADPATDAIQTVTDSAIFAKAALTNTATAVDVLTTAVNAYGKENITTTQASDIFFNTIKQGKITGEQLSSTIGQSISLFASAGVSLEELSAGMAAMTKQGVPVAETTTQLNALVTSFLTPSAKMAQALQDIGFESGSAFLEAEGLAGALSLLEEATGGDAAAMNAFLPNVRAMKGAMALTGQGATEFNKILLSMGDVSGDTLKAFEKQEKTLATLRNSFGKTQIIVGNMAKFFGDDLAGSLTDVTDSINEFLLSEEGFNKINNAITKTAGVLSVIKSVATGLFDSIKNLLTPAIETFKEEWSDLTDASGETLDVFQVLAPVLQGINSAFAIAGRIVSLLTGYVINLITVYKEAFTVASSFIRFIKGEADFSEVKDNFKDLGNSVTDLVGDALGDIGEIFTTTVDEFNSFGDKQKEQADKLRKTWDDSTRKTAQLVKDNYEKMTLGIAGNDDDTLEKKKKKTEETVVVQKTGLQKMLENIKTFSDNSQKLWEESGKQTMENVMTVVDSVVDIYQKIFDTIDLGFETELNKLAAKNDEETEMIKAQGEKKQSVIDESFQAESDELAAQREAGLITQEEFDAAKTMLDEQKAADTIRVKTETDERLAAQEKKKNKKENEIKKKQFEADKANQIANIWIQYALGLVGLWSQSLAQFGPIAGSVIAGVMTAALTGVAIANTALISQQQFIPAREKGGMAGGITRINEAGGEIVSLPDGSQVIPNDISNQIAASVGGGAGRNINVSFAGANIDSSMSLRKITNQVVGTLTSRLREA